MIKKENAAKMSDTRSQDRSINPNPNRSERIFSQQNLWYFKVREGTEVGPFRYRSEAQSNLERFVEDLEDKLKPS
jgi:hypothetical protein